MACYSYMRCSGYAQGKKGDSIRRQSDMALEWAKAKGITLDTSLNLLDRGVSGFKGKNLHQGAGLARFLAAIEDGRVQAGDTLLIEALDRLSRQTPTIALQLFLDIIGKGVRIVTLRNGNVFEENEKRKLNLQDLMMSVMEICLANQESEAKADRIGKAWQQKRNNCLEKKLTASVVPWLKLNEDKKSFTVITDVAAVVKKIFQMALAGDSIKTIALYLHSHNIKPFRKSPHWHPSNIRKLLKNRVVIGEVQHQTYTAGKRKPIGEPVANYYPAIIAEKDFNAVQAGIKNRRRNFAGRTGTNCRNLFTGIVRMIDAKSGMVSPLTVVNKYLNKDEPYLVAYNAARGIEGHEYILFDYATFEIGFLKWINEVNFGKMNKSNKENIELLSTQEEISSLNKKLDKIKAKLFELEDIPDSFIEVVREMEAKKKTMSQKLQALKEDDSKKPVKDSLSELKAMDIRTGDISLRTRAKSLVADVVEAIDMYLYKDDEKQSKVLIAAVEFKDGQQKLFTCQTWRQGHKSKFKGKKPVYNFAPVKGKFLPMLDSADDKMSKEDLQYFQFIADICFRENAMV